MSVYFGESRDEGRGQRKDKERKRNIVLSGFLNRYKYQVYERSKKDLP